jgi:hypothetical protein
MYMHESLFTSGKETWHVVKLIKINNSHKSEYLLNEFTDIDKPFLQL